MKHLSAFLYFMSAAAISTFFIGCTDELPQPNSHNGRDLCFNMITDNGWQPGKTSSRSSSRSANSSLHGNGVIPMEGDGKQMYLHSYVYDGIDNDTSRVKSAATRSVTDVAVDHFALTAYHYNGDWDGGQTLYINKQIVRPTGDIWSFQSGERYWPGSGRLRFLACFPSGSNRMGVHTSDPNPGELMTLSYSTPTNAWDQPDIICAIGDTIGNLNKAYPLKFHHALAKVIFKISTNGKMLSGTVNSVSIRGIYTKGTYSFPDGATVNREMHGSWDIDYSSTDSVYRGSEFFDGTPATADISYNPATHFMLLPQTVPDGAEVIFSFTDAITHPELFDITHPDYVFDDAERRRRTIAAGRILVASIGGQVWEQEKTTIYKISANSIDMESTLDATPTSFTFPYRGGSNNIHVESKAVISEVGKAPVEANMRWKSEFVDNSGNVIPTPHWVQNLQETSLHSGNFAFDVDVPNIENEEYRDSWPHVEHMRSLTPVSGVYDFSTKGGTKPMCTANCYIVNRAGTYKFPLVYGNAIHEGADNRKAYTYKQGTTAAPGNVLATFLNHRDAPITSPYIYLNDGCKPGKVALLWQDEDGLVQSSSVKLVDNNTYIQFSTIGQSQIREGNAVIAVYDEAGSTIMWSWHIWFTDYELDNVVGTEPGYDPTRPVPTDKHIADNRGSTALPHSYTFMPINLGWCNDRIREYFGRTATIKISQVVEGIGYGEGALPIYIKIEQLPATIILEGNSPYYQFGRKDPLLPFAGSKYINGDFKDKNMYPNKIYKREAADNSTSIGKAIQNPATFYYASNHDWCNKNYYNIWSSDIATAADCGTDINDIKTIYDPCPVGYEVPDLYAFTLATCEGKNTVLQDVYKRVNSPYPTPDEAGYAKMEQFRDDLGWTFYCSFMRGVNWWDKTTSYIYFPAIGVRGNNGTIAYGNQRGYYWASTPQLKGDHPEWYSSVFEFIDVIVIDTDDKFKTAVNPSSQTSRASGCSIRPIRQQHH